MPAATQPLDQLLARIPPGPEDQQQRRAGCQVKDGELEVDDHRIDTVNVLVYSSKSLTRTVTVSCQSPRTPSTSPLAT